jgi:hypothetical protein
MSPDQPQFFHRSNDDGTFDSICLQCFRTVATQSHEANIAAKEQAHVCSEYEEANFLALGSPEPEATKNDPYRNYYVHCGIEWSGEWTWQRTDTCPACRKDIEPWAYTNRSKLDVLNVLVPKTWVPEGGWPLSVFSLTDLIAMVIFGEDDD